MTYGYAQEELDLVKKGHIRELLEERDTEAEKIEVMESCCRFNLKAEILIREVQPSSLWTI